MSQNPQNPVRPKFVLWREYYALTRYAIKHFAANPQIDRKWLSEERMAIAELMCNDERPTWEEGIALEDQYEMIWGKEPWPKA